MSEQTINSDITTKQKTRILTPTEYEKLRAAMISAEDQKTLDIALAKGDKYTANRIQRYQIICDVLLQTGMRPIEFKRLQPSWYRGARRCLELPPGACLKEKCEYKERTIKLSLPGCDAVERYLNAEVKVGKEGKIVYLRDVKPEKVAMRDALRRYAIKAGIQDIGVTPKMFRKTLVSWLVACYPERSLYIQSSMGHNADTIVKNYMGIVFLKEERIKMREKYLVEWGIDL